MSNTTPNPVAGSLDDVMDIVDACEACGLAYVLMIGLTGEDKVRMFGNAHEFEVHGVTDANGLDTMEAAFPAYVKRVRDEMKGAAGE